MTPVIYDGKKRSAQLKKSLAKKIARLKEKKGITPTLAIIKVSDVLGADKYTQMKQKAAEEVGAVVDIYDMNNAKHTFQDVMQMIRYLNNNEEYQGIMVQLPVPRKMKGREQMMFSLIEPVKDVDGLADESTYIKPVTLAVLDAVKSYQKKFKKKKLTILVVGAKGFVGSDVLKNLEKEGHEVRGVDRSISKTFHDRTILKNAEGADLIVTATGEYKLLYDRNVPKEIGIIDVGAPKPEVDLAYLEGRLTYLTPVPGGVGPVTIAYLLENLYKAAYTISRKRKSHT